MRRSLGKKLRFEVFARDGFACRYCGRQSDGVQLVVDHIVPVCQGGTNDQSNLITSCADCNSGKGGKTISQSVVSEEHRLSMSQDFQDQIHAAKLAVEAAKAAGVLRDEILKYYCRSRGKRAMSPRTLAILVAYAKTSGPEAVFRWIDIAVAGLDENKSDNDFGRYISGIKRIEERENEA